jgi:hypothetical protein
MKRVILLSGLLICLLAGASKAQAQSAIIKGRIIDSLTRDPAIGEYR